MTAVWGWLTGWWTPGWGNLFTVAIATAALGVGAYFNKRTLRRADERHDQGRVDATTDKLRNELVELFTDIEVCRSQTRRLGMRLQELAAVVHSGVGINPEALNEYRSAAHVAYQETLPEVHLRLAAHEFKLMLLTTDELILRTTGEIRRLILEDKADFEILVLAESLPLVTATLYERGVTLLERHESRNKEIFDLFVKLGKYCTKEFATAFERQNPPTS